MSKVWNFFKNLKFRIFTNFTDFFEFHKLWTATKCAQIIALIEVMGVLKTFYPWIINGVKQKGPNVISDCRVLLILGSTLGFGWSINPSKCTNNCFFESMKAFNFVGCIVIVVQSQDQEDVSSSWKQFFLGPVPL